MKKLIFGLMALFLAVVLPAQSLTKAERKDAIKYINWSTKELKKSLKGLSDAQLIFKPAPESWSAQECLYHIAVSEVALGDMLDKALAAPPNPAAKAELTATDEQIKTMIVDRSTKVKTMEPFEPQNAGYKSKNEAWTAFNNRRSKLLNLVKTSGIDMRSQIIDLPVGKADAYQFILFIAGHTNRHTQQINEVKKAAGYPKA